MRSPIEMLIDEATGYKPTTPQERLSLRCPQCNKTSTTPKLSRDPQRAVRMETLCPECAELNVSDCSIRFFDVENNLITRKVKVTP